MSSRTLLAVTALFLAGSAPAKAQDAFGSGAYWDTPAVSTWDGLYVGGLLGGHISDGRASLGKHGGDLILLDVANGLFPRHIEDTDSGVIGGFALGMNVQAGGLVYGAEADFSFTGLSVDLGRNRIDPNPNPIFNGVQTITGYETDFDTIGTVRGRLGAAFGETLIYGTAGLAYGDVTNRFSLRIPELGYVSPDWHESGYEFGYAIGGGLERKITSEISLRAEALFVDLDDVTVHATDPDNFPGQTLSYEFDNESTILRAGISYHF